MNQKLLLRPDYKVQIEDISDSQTDSQKIADLQKQKLEAKILEARSNRFISKEFEQEPELASKLIAAKALVFEYPTQTHSSFLIKNVVQIPHNFLLPTSQNAQEILEGFGLVGGAARSGLSKFFNGQTLAIRDLDLIALRNINPYPQNTEEVTKEFMPDDYKYTTNKAAFLKIKTLRQELSRTDFVINQIIITNEFIYTTFEAIKDMNSGVIRLSEFEKDKYDYISDRILLRALKLVLDLKQNNSEANFILDIEEDRWSEINSWDIGLFLQKSADLGVESFLRNFRALIDLGSIYVDFELDIKDENAVLNFAKDYMKSVQTNTSFTFRSKALEILNTNYKSEIDLLNFELIEDNYKENSQKQKIQKVNLRESKVKLNS
jgi:hypothetical protein